MDLMRLQLWRGIDLDQLGLKGASNGNGLLCTHHRALL
jgi:hypothetical protein